MCPRLDKRKICKMIMLAGAVIGFTAYYQVLCLDEDMDKTARHVGVFVNELKDVVQVSTGKKYKYVYEYTTDHTRGLLYTNEDYICDIRQDSNGIKHLYKRDYAVMQNYFIAIAMLVISGAAFLLSYLELIDGSGGGLPGGM